MSLGSVAVSSSCSIVAIASTNESRIKFYDVSSSHLKFTLFASKVNDGKISKLMFSNADTHILGRIADSNDIIVWDIIRGVEAYRISISDGIELCDFTSRDSLITALVHSSNNDKFLAFEYNLSNGKLTRKIKAGSSKESKHGKIQCSPCGSLYAVVIDKHIRLLNTETGERKNKISVKTVCTEAALVEFSSNAMNVLYSSNGKNISMYSVEGKRNKAFNMAQAQSEHDIRSMSLNEVGLVVTFTNGTSTLFLTEDNKSIKSTHNISVKQGTIVQSNFHSSSPHQKLQVILLDESVWCETLEYCSETKKTLLSESHAITKQDSSAEASERPLKKAKYESEQDDDFGYNENDLTIAERLKALNKEIDTEFSDDESKADEEKATQEGTLSVVKVGTTKGFSSILKQVLQSNDDKTLDENIFQSKYATDRNLIVNSIAELSSHELNLLICKLVHRCTAQPYNLGMYNIFVSWIQPILVQAYQRAKNGDVTNEESAKEGLRALNVMRNLAMGRVSNMEALTGLEARLALVSGHF